MCLKARCQNAYTEGAAMIKCAVVSCGEKPSDSNQLHVVPENAVRRIQWLSALGLADTAPRKDLAVCSRHFLPSDFAEKGILSEEAVPSLHLTESALKTALQSPGKRKRKNSRELALLDAANNVVVDQPSVGRPSRRAARVAAAKISDTVKKYNLASTPPHGQDSDEDFDLEAEQRAEGVTRTTLLPSMVILSSPIRQHLPSQPAQWPPRDCTVTPSLWMECDDDKLSQVQMMAHARSVRAYERSSRRIQEARASGSKVLLCRPRLSLPAEVVAVAANPTTTAVVPKESVQATKPLKVSTGNGNFVGCASSPRQNPLVPNAFHAEQSMPAPKSLTEVHRQEAKPRPLPLIFGGNTAVTAKSLLAAKVVPQQVLSEDSLKEKVRQLDDQYYNIVDRDNPIPWLAERGILRVDLACKVCKVGKMAIKADTSLPFHYALECAASKCKRRLALSQPSFFARLKLPHWKAVALLFHWARQSSMDDVLEELQLTAEQMRSVWRAIQDVCSQAIEICRPQLGGPGVQVQLGMVQMGRFLVIGALDQETGLTRLKVVSISMGWNSPLFVKCLENWLKEETVLLLPEGKDCSIPSIKVAKENGETPRKVEAYMMKKLTEVFGHFVVNQLRLDSIQGFLDELQWRERFGSNARDAFWGIFRDCIEHGGWKASFSEMMVDTPVPPLIGSRSSAGMPSLDSSSDCPEVINCDSSGDDEDDKPLAKYSKADASPAEKCSDSSAQDTGETLSNIHHITVVLDEHYYARKMPSRRTGPPLESRGIFQFKCPVCKKVIDNNVKMVKHIVAHIEGSRQKNPDLSDLTVCKFCFREFETPYSMQCHMEAAHLKEEGIVCRICSQEFDLVPSLVDHMKLNHSASEMPYSCQLCGYRSSFHEDILTHFHQEHSGTNALLCRFCLKVYIIKSLGNATTLGLQRFYSHLFKHLGRTSVRRCPICCLVFFNVSELKAHREKDHVSAKNQNGVKPVECSASSPILVPDPHIKPRKLVQPVQYSAPSPTLTSPSSCQPKFFVPAVTLEPKSLAHTCFECRKPIDENHFARWVSCSLCRYSTYCTKAFAEHAFCRHSSKKRHCSLSNHLRPVTLLKPGSCPCGYHSADGNILVSHMLQCEEETARVEVSDPAPIHRNSTCSMESSSSPAPSLDFESAGLNEPFSEVFSSSVPTDLASDMHAPVPVHPLPSPFLELDEEEPEGPSLLNLLGLMRRPSSLSTFEECDSDLRKEENPWRTSRFVRPMCAREKRDVSPTAAPTATLDTKGVESVEPMGVGDPPSLQPESISETTSSCSSVDAPTLESELRATEYEVTSLERPRFEQEKSWPILEPCIILDSTA
ncbi:uncharacterized protein LOC135385750 isoform X2 [Ornithodoros turicata]|uniref:uncharacterized protein LOC135385750 isoform X2 n=1 Tax=Ornithodoros turicata TaxID=34597 RepID=UPI003138E037